MRSAAVVTVMRFFALIAAAAWIASCGPKPGSVGDTPTGPSFASLSLPNPSQVDPDSFEKQLRAEFANFAKAQGLKFADSSEAQQQIQSKKNLVWVMAYEKDVSVLVDWGGVTLNPNWVAVFGDGTAARPRAVYDALIQHLTARNIPFTVVKAPPK